MGNSNMDINKIISQALSVKPDNITNITLLKKGMTNRSFLFSIDEKRYIIRFPGSGTEMLINRQEEYNVYQCIRSLNICDNVVYMEPETGIKITEFFENARTCNAGRLPDVKQCMEQLRSFHNANFQVPHTFDLFRQIEFYESLWNGKPSFYADYSNTKHRIFELKSFVEKHRTQNCLSHIDAVCDNFLFIKDSSGQEQIRLIDWEYAGMQDPHVDIAMFAIYAYYNRKQVDDLINLYFCNKCPKDTRIKIYCYIAICGLLWSNWCEYKKSLGATFDNYAQKQYQYAKDYYKIVQEELDSCTR